MEGFLKTFGANIKTQFDLLESESKAQTLSLSQTLAIVQTVALAQTQSLTFILNQIQTEAFAQAYAQAQAQKV